MFGRVVPFEPFHEPPCLGGRKRFVERRGLVRRPTRKPDPEAFRTLPRPDFGDVDVVKMIIEERESSL